MYSIGSDVEGWHRRINHHAKKSNLPCYVLVKLLHEEADSIDITVCLLSEKKLCQHQYKHYCCMQSHLFIIWEDYIDNQISISKLLKECSNLINP